MRTPAASLVPRLIPWRVLFLWLSLVMCQSAAEAETIREERPLPADRLTAVYEGIRCEYSPGQEELARALALRFARHNEQVLAMEPPKAAISRELLSPAEMRTNRAAYLGRIAALLALEQPTALQQECYDAFLANYEETMIRCDLLRTGFHALLVVRQVAVWDRAELVHRFERGETVAGMTYDPATDQGGVAYGGQLVEQTSERVEALAQERQKLKIGTSLNVETKEGVTTYRARFETNPKPKTAPAPAAASSLVLEGASEWFPVIIPADVSQESSPERQAEILWEEMDNSVVKMFEHMVQMGDSFPRLDPQIAFLVLHETVEMGVIDRYFRGKDRRWFCDGVANYGAWRVLRDLHGEELATRIHNLPAKLQELSDLREKVDLKKWATVENEPAGKAFSPLVEAHYILAERAVFLMNAQGGEDVLPRLFTEIGKTKPNKVSMKTVDKAWQKVSGTKLDTILTAAAQPLPAASTALPATAAAK